MRRSIVQSLVTIAYFGTNLLYIYWRPGVNNEKMQLRKSSNERNEILCDIHVCKHNMDGSGYWVDYCGVLSIVIQCATA